MKKTLLTLFFIFLLMHLYAQKIEWSAGINSGLFHYSGNSTASTSFMNNDGANRFYTVDPYGNKNGISYGGNIQAQYVTKSGFIAGLQGGYDFLRSKVDINNVYPFFITFFGPAVDYYISQSTAATGRTYLQDKAINLSPYVGYRIKIKHIKIDLMPGLDLGFTINAYDKGKATAVDGTTYQTDFKLAKTNVDFRAKLGATVYYNKWGLNASFAHGLTNYAPALIYYPPGVTYNGTKYYPKAYSELFRLGVTYRIF